MAVAARPEGEENSAGPGPEAAYVCDAKKAEGAGGSCLSSYTPCALLAFVRSMHRDFGGYVPMSVLTYCLNEGFAFPVARMALKVYFLDVVGLDGATAARYTMVVKVGWIAKPFVGVLSDALPIFGFRRSSYLALACVGGLAAWTCLGLWGLPARAALPFLVLAGLSLSVPDIMVDTSACELVKQRPERASDTQSLNFASFAVGGLLACMTSGMLVRDLGARMTFMVLNLGLAALLLATLLRWLPEERVPVGKRGLDLPWLRQHARTAGLSAFMTAAAAVLVTLQVCMHNLELRLGVACVFAVFVPLGFYLGLRGVSETLARAALFVFLHGCLQPSYPDTMFQWMRRAKDGPHFSTVVLGWTDCFGSLGLLAGVALYNRVLSRWSYRKIFALAIVATVVPSLLDVVLVKRWNPMLHIPDLALAIGDEALSDGVLRLFRMPVAVLAMKACPKGLEGSVMSLVASLGGFGHCLGVLLGSCVLDALGVKRGHFERFPEALALRGLCRLVPLFFLPLLIPAGLSPSSGLESHGGAQRADEGEKDAEEANPKAAV